MRPSDPESAFWRTLRVTYTSARRIIIGVVGLTVVLAGVAMLVLPGPAFVVIPAGLAILGIEFAFARRWLQVLEKQARNGLNAVGLGTSASAQQAPERRSLNGDASSRAVDRPESSPSRPSSDRVDGAAGRPLSH